MDHQLKGLILVILAFTTLSNGCRCDNKPQKNNKYKFGYESRLVSSLIPMNCKENNIAIYNDYYAYRLRENDYELSGFTDSVGSGEEVFSIHFKNYVDHLSQMKNARISICKNGKLYIGLPILAGVSSYPPESHFCFRYDSLNTLKINKQGILYLGSVRYLSQKKYDELIGSK